MICIFLLLPVALAAERVSVSPEYLDELKAAGKDEEFAKLLGIDVSLVSPKEEERSYSSLMSTASPLGDILLDPEEKARQGINLNKYNGNRWPNNQVPYVINRNNFNASQIQVIQSAIDEFNSRVSNIKLVPRRWLFPQRDYVYVFSGNGCYSHLGKTGRQQPLSLQYNGCVYTGTVQHEFMHAIGFTHEQNRPDRDNYVEILYQNIPEEWHRQYDKVSEEDFVILADYDYYSVMHYPTWNPTGSGDPAIKILQEGIDESRVGDPRIPMNDIDVEKIDKLYA